MIRFIALSGNPPSWTLLVLSFRSKAIMEGFLQVVLFEDIFDSQDAKQQAMINMYIFLGQGVTA